MMGFLFDENLPRVLSLPTSLPVIQVYGCQAILARMITDSKRSS